MMKMSDKGLMASISHEGVVQTRYKDAVGVWTIGVGHTAAAGPPDPAKVVGVLTMSEVFDLLRRDMSRYEDDVRKAVKVALEQHEFDALVSWHYNTGRIARASFLADLNAGRKRAAGEKLRTAIVTAKGKRLQALVDRRAAESALFLEGKYPKPFANLYPASPHGKVLWDKGERIDLVRALQASGKPAGAQEQPKATEQPPRPEPAPAPSSEDATAPKGPLAAFAAAIAVLVAGLFWSGACLVPQWFIEWAGYAARCTGVN